MSRTQPSSEKAFRIALVRHGRSAHVHAGWVDHAGLEAWRTTYEAAGIREGERVPDPVAQLLKNAEVFVSSDARRAVESAKLLAGDREVLASPLLRELELRGPRIGNIRLPLGAWAVLIGLRSLFLSIRSRQSPSEVSRASEAASWLMTIAKEHGFVAVVTHASFRRRLASRLLDLGCHRDLATSSLRHWSVWMFVQSGSSDGQI